MLSMLSYVSGPSVCPPWRICLFRSFTHFLIGLLVFFEWSHVSSLYILEIRSLSEVSLPNMFSHMVGSLFVLMFSLAMKKLFKFDTAPLVYFFLLFSLFLLFLYLSFFFINWTHYLRLHNLPYVYKLPLTISTAQNLQLYPPYSIH